MVSKRNSSIDTLRGGALVLMLVHHVCLYSLGFVGEPVWVDICGCISRIIFIFLVGFSSEWAKQRPLRRLKRAVVIGAHAAVVTLVTSYFFPGRGVAFGVLHFICVSYIISTPLIGRPLPVLLTLGLLLLTRVPATGFRRFDVAFGLAEPTRTMIDYFPVKKWLPLVLFGQLAAFVSSAARLPSSNIDVPFLSLLGRNSLEIYTAHTILLSMLFRTSS